MTSSSKKSKVIFILYDIFLSIHLTKYHTEWINRSLILSPCLTLQFKNLKV